MGRTYTYLPDPTHSCLRVARGREIGKRARLSRSAHSFLTRAAPSFLFFNLPIKMITPADSHSSKRHADADAAADLAAASAAASAARDAKRARTAVADLLARRRADARAVAAAECRVARLGAATADAQAAADVEVAEAAAAASLAVSTPTDRLGLAADAAAADADADERPHLRACLAVPGKDGREPGPWPVPGTVEGAWDALAAAARVSGDPDAEDVGAARQAAAAALLASSALADGLRVRRPGRPPLGEHLGRALWTLATCGAHPRHARPALHALQAAWEGDGAGTPSAAAPAPWRPTDADLEDALTSAGLGRPARGGEAPDLSPTSAAAARPDPFTAVASPTALARLPALSIALGAVAAACIAESSARTAGVPRSALTLTGGRLWQVVALTHALKMDPAGRLVAAAADAACGAALAALPKPEWSARSRHLAVAASTAAPGARARLDAVRALPVGAGGAGGTGGARAVALRALAALEVADTLGCSASGAPRRPGGPAADAGARIAPPSTVVEGVGADVVGAIRTAPWFAAPTPADAVAALLGGRGGVGGAPTRPRPRAVRLLLEAADDALWPAVRAGLDGSTDPPAPPRAAALQAAAGWNAFVQAVSKAVARGAGGGVGGGSAGIAGAAGRLLSLTAAAQEQRYTGALQDAAGGGGGGVD